MNDTEICRFNDVVEDIEGLVNLLCVKDAKIACCAMKQLEEFSKKTDAVYKYMDKFTEMIDDNNSYIRNRGINLIAVNARWDKDYKIDEIIDKYLKHITDAKPITARQCIKALPEIAKYKPELCSDIIAALSSADISHYAESMLPLVLKDIKEALNKIEISEKYIK